MKLPVIHSEAGATQIHYAITLPAGAKRAPQGLGQTKPQRPCSPEDSALACQFSQPRPGPPPLPTRVLILKAPTPVSLGQPSSGADGWCSGNSWAQLPPKDTALGRAWNTGSDAIHSPRRAPLQQARPRDGMSWGRGWPPPSLTKQWRGNRTPNPRNTASSSAAAARAGRCLWGRVACWALEWWGWGQGGDLSFWSPGLWLPPPPAPEPALGSGDPGVVLNLHRPPQAMGAALPAPAPQSGAGTVVTVRLQARILLLNSLAHQTWAAWWE